MKLTQILLQKVGKWSKQFSNLPDRYIKRAMEQVYWRNPKGKVYNKICKSSGNRTLHTLH